MNAPFSLPLGFDDPPVADQTPRQLIESAIEALVALLDVFEPDPDLEPSTNSTSGPFTTDIGREVHVASGDLDECEDVGDDEPDNDGEPSLGSLGSTWPSFYVGGQTNWAGGADDDREGDPDDDEPSLGWTATIRQSGSSWYGPHIEPGMLDIEGEHDGREPLSRRDDREQEDERHRRF